MDLLEGDKVNGNGLLQGEVNGDSKGLVNPNGAVLGENQME